MPKLKTVEPQNFKFMQPALVNYFLSMPPGTHVGERGECHSCPIANYILDRLDPIANPGYWVSVTSEDYAITRGDSSVVVSRSLPEWVTTLIERVDADPFQRGNRYVTAEEMLEHLEALDIT